MKTEEILKFWKDKKCQMETEGDFSSKVMGRIYRYEQQRKKSLFDIARLVEIAASNPLAKAAMIIGGAAIGVLRIVFLLRTFLWC